MARRKTTDALAILHDWNNVGGGTSFPPAPWDHEMYVTVLPGARLPAQDNDNSPERFVTHYVVRRGALLYDPSYGSAEYASRTTHEAASFWGYGALGRDLDNQRAGADNTWYCTPDRPAQSDTRVIVW